MRYGQGTGKSNLEMLGLLENTLQNDLERETLVRRIEFEEQALIDAHVSITRIVPSLLFSSLLFSSLLFSSLLMQPRLSSSLLLYTYPLASCHHLPPGATTLIVPSFLCVPSLLFNLFSFNRFSLLVTRCNRSHCPFSSLITSSLLL